MKTLNKNSTRKLSTAILAVLVFAVGFGTAYLWSEQKFKKKLFAASETLAEGTNVRFPLLHPLAGKLQNLFIAVSPLRKEIEKTVKDYSQFHVGVYFESLRTGAWVGINEKEIFYPASLLKVPIAIAFLKSVEEKQYALDEEIEVKAKDLNQEYGAWYREKTVGQKASFREVLTQMLKRSDNTARNMLIRYVSEAENRDVYEYLNLEVPENQSSHLSLKKYGTIFRSLYWADYLNEENSEFLLSLLVDSERPDLIPASLPPSAKVAHKFGVAQAQETLVDCGIVYLEPSRYLLCVSVKGQDAVDKGSEVISAVSRTIYDYISQNVE